VRKVCGIMWEMKGIRCRAIWNTTRQSRPDSGLDLGHLASESLGEISVDPSPLDSGGPVGRLRTTALQKRAAVPRRARI